MNDVQLMRASDWDRQEIVDRLRSAVADGRLSMDEYMDRMGRAYEAVTYGDLAPLTADLPATRQADQRATIAPPAVAARRGLIAGLPTPLRVLWSIWLTAVMINVFVWAMVSVTSGHFAYPWPLWVAGPYGAALFAMSFGCCGIKSNRLSAKQRTSWERG